MGTGTTNLAAALWGRNSIGVELNAKYFKLAATRLRRDGSSLFQQPMIIEHETRNAA
jgi:DNA modification methylase